MNKILLVGLGGFFGAAFRYLISEFIQKFAQNTAFPLGILTVNMLGCFLIGVLSFLVETHSGITSEMRLLLIVGLLGSFTTYSTFSNDTINLIQDHRIFLALANIGTHIIIGLVAVLLGRFAIMTILNKL